MYCHHWIEGIFLVVYPVTYKKLLTALTVKYFWQKIKFYEISGIANKLMRSYLESRCQRMSMKDKPNKLSSKCVHVKDGVPQDLVLGPLLFLICINNHSLSISELANLILFADNTSIII